MLRAWLFSPTQARLRLLDEAGVPCGPIIRRIQAEVYGLPVVRVNREEGPAYGAAPLAAVGVGAFADLAAACRATLKRLPPERPRPEAHRAYDEPYRTRTRPESRMSRLDAPIWISYSPGSTAKAWLATS